MSAEAFVCSAGILRREDTVIIVRKVTTGIQRDRSRIVRHANVSTARQTLITANLVSPVPGDLLIRNYLGVISTGLIASSLHGHSVSEELNIPGFFILTLIQGESIGTS